MVLVDANGTKFEGMHFHPSIEQHDGFSEVHPRMAVDSANAKALTIGSAVVAHAHTHITELMMRNAADTGYVEAMQKTLAALHEPRVIRP